MKHIKLFEELKIEPKQKLGNGAFHDVYPYKNDDTKVIKKIRNHKNDLQNPKSWFNIFKKHPDIFPIIYKVTDTYVIVEKLDSKRANQELSILRNDILRNASSISDELEEDDITTSEFLYKYVIRDKEVVKSLNTKLENKIIFKNWVKCLSKIYVNSKSFSTFVDVNDENFGYDIKGKLKMLDI